MEGLAEARHTYEWGPHWRYGSYLINIDAREKKYLRCFFIFNILYFLLAPRENINLKRQMEASPCHDVATVSEEKKFFLKKKKYFLFKTKKKSEQWNFSSEIIL